MNQDKLISAFNDFLASLENKIEKKEMINIINIVYTNLKAKNDKTKRVQSDYNKFMSENMALLKNTDEGVSMTGKDKMRHIAKMWKSVKDDEVKDDEVKKVNKTPRKPLTIKSDTGVKREEVKEEEVKKEEVKKSGRDSAGKKAPRKALM